jgi:hypothetical protein
MADRMGLAMRGGMRDLAGEASGKVLEKDPHENW